MVLLTDVVGSTDLLRRLGDGAGEHVLRTCLDRLREPIRGRGGREVKSLGDGLLVAFPTAGTALSAAVAMQRSLVGHNALPGSVPLAIRIGIHAGDVVEDESGDLVGLAVVVASRLCDAAEGGQILVSESARSRLGAAFEHPLRPVGRLQLKGVGERIGAYELTWAPGEAGPAPRRAPTRTVPRPGVLRSRLLPPRVPRDALRRPLLIERVQRGFAGRLVMVVAGPGYGKSTLLSQALEGHADPSVWLSCDERLRSADALVGHLIEGIDRLFPGVGGRLPHHGAPEDLVMALCNELVQTVTDDFLIVVDDAHALHGHPGEDALGLLVRDLPPNVHVAMASRTSLPAADARASSGWRRQP